MTKLFSQNPFFCGVLLFLFYSLSAYAATPDPAQLTEADEAAVKASINEYLDRLDHLESQYGAYETELQQELGSLGILYQSVGMHDEAVDAFKRQYQIERTNVGLYSAEQINILRNMIVSLVATREWEEVEDRHFFIQQLMAYNYPANDPRKVALLTERADWHMYAGANNIDDKSPLHHFLTARNSLSEATRLTYIPGSPMTDEIEDMYQQLLYLDYQVAIAERAAASQGQSSPRLSSRTRTDAYFYSRSRSRSNDAFGPTNRTQVSSAPTLGLNSFRNGFSRLERLRDSYAADPSGKTSDVGRIEAQMADWCSIWLKQSSAQSYYQRAWQTLSQPGVSPEARAEVFDQPVRLTDFLDEHDAKPATSKSVKQGYVIYDLYIDATGRVRSLEVVEALPNTLTKHISRTNRSVSKTRYRPRYVDGAPVATEKYRTKALFTYTTSDEANQGG